MTYKSFKYFLFNLVIDPINRRLLAYKKWKKIK